MAEKQVSLKLLVDNKKNRILTAEAGKDFVDALLSFLTLPLGTIARITKNQDSNLKSVRVGSLNSLYQSVADLEEKYFGTEFCKQMLLHPRNSMESHQNPKLNIDDESEPVKYFVCENWDCDYWQKDSLATKFKNTRCRCGRRMDHQISLLRDSLQGKKIHEGFVNELEVFTLSDDLKLMPTNLLSSIVLMQNLGFEDMDSVEEKSVNVTKEEMVDLLKCSLHSRTPLTDLFLLNKEVQEDFESDDFFHIDFKTPRDPSEQAQAQLAEDDTNTRMKVKVVLQKSKGKVLFAQSEEDFTNFLLSFLTLPLGSVLNILEGNSGCVSLDNLFRSLGSDLHASRNLKSEEIKNKLIKPQIAPQFKLQKQILPIDEATDLDYTYKGCSVTMVDPKLASRSDDDGGGGGFVKGPSMFMVTDDLVVTPISSISVASFLCKSGIPFYDLEERVISIGLEEGLGILRASLISSSVLTTGLSPFIGRN